MDTSACGALAVELRPESPTGWIAIYYPMVDTAAGRWADVTWVLHQRPMPMTEGFLEPARWLDLRSSDPNHPAYPGPRAWREALAVGYTAALAVHQAEGAEGPLTAQQVQQLRDESVVVPAGQLAEWVLDDLEETSTTHR